MRWFIFVLACLGSFAPAAADVCESVSRTWDFPSPTHLAIHPAGYQVAVAQGPSGRVVILDVRNNAQVVIGEGAVIYPQAVSFDANGRLYVLDASETIRVFDVEGNELSNWQLPHPVSTITVGGNRVYGVSSLPDSGLVESWPLGGGVAREEDRFRGSPISLTTRPDGTVLVAYHQWWVGQNSSTHVQTVPLQGSANVWVGLYRVTATPAGGLLLSGVSELRLLDENYQTQCSVLESGRVFQNAVADRSGSVYAIHGQFSGQLVRFLEETAVEHVTWGALKTRWD